MTSKVALWDPYMHICTHEHVHSTHTHAHMCTHAHTWGRGHYAYSRAAMPSIQEAETENCKLKACLYYIGPISK